MVDLQTSTRMMDVPIPQFYAGRSVFITGATGFMGKVLVERLLATCPDVGRIYLLVRTKKGVTPKQRLQRLKETQVFDIIRQSSPAQLDKLHILPGDITQPALGLAEESIAQLKEVSIVFHSAATIKYHAPALRAVQDNLLAVIALLKICDQLPKLQAFVYVSTAYSNCELPEIDEKVYPPPAPLDVLLAAAEESTSDQEFDKKIQEYKAKKTNTYTFTKAMAESAVQQHGNRGYPVAIFRPTIVISSVKHPFPGWTENMNGPNGVVVGTGKGVLNVHYLNPSGEADILPVDIAIDTLIAVAWETALDNCKQTRVYNCTVSENGITWGHFGEKVIEYSRRYPFDDVLWYPGGYITNNWYVYKALVFMLMTVPHYCAAYLARLFSIKSTFCRCDLITISKRMSAVGEIFEFFCLHEWRFENNNVKRLRQRLHPADKDIFNLEAQSIKWDHQIRDYIRGVRKYILKEKDQDIMQAKRHLKRMFSIHVAVKACFITIVGWFLYIVFTSC